MVTENKKPGNPNWGGNRLECKVIQRRADQWCKDNDGNSKFTTTDY